MSGVIHYLKVKKFFLTVSYRVSKDADSNFKTYKANFVKNEHEILLYLKNLSKTSITSFLK
jgi:hypothetical protein